MTGGVLQIAELSVATATACTSGCAIVATRDDGETIRGYRCALGASMAGLARELWREPHGYLMLVMPQQIELGWIHDAVTTHFGITLSYGI